MFTKAATLALFLGSAAASTKATDIVRGVIMGAAEVEIDAKCIQDVEVVIQDAEAVVKDFEQKSFKSIVEGVKEVIKTVGDVKHGIADCTGSKSIMAKLSTLEAVMSNPTSFAYHIGKDIMINENNIRKEVVQAVADYQKADFYNFGVQVGEAAALTIIGQEERIEGVEVFQGFTTQYGGHFNLDALLACIGEEDKAALILNEVIPIIEDGIETKNVEEIIGGAIGIYAAYQQAMQGLPACEAIDRSTFSKINQDVTVASTQVNLLEMTSDSYVQIIEKMYKDYEAKDLEALGADLAELLQKIVNKETAAPVQEEKISRKDIASLVQGYFEATNVGEFNFTALLECIYVADQAAEVAEMEYHLVMQAIEDRSIKEVIPAAIGAIALVQAAKQALPMCEAIDMSTANWTTYNNILSTVEAPVKFMKVVDHEIVANGQAVTKEIGNTFNAIRSGDFYTAGLELGTMLKNTCEPESTLFLY